MFSFAALLLEAKSKDSFLDFPAQDLTLQLGLGLGFSFEECLSLGVSLRVRPDFRHFTAIKILRQTGPHTPFLRAWPSRARCVGQVECWVSGGIELPLGRAGEFSLLSTVF